MNFHVSMRSKNLHPIQSFLSWRKDKADHETADDFDVTDLPQLRFFRLSWRYVKKKSQQQFSQKMTENFDSRQKWRRSWFLSVEIYMTALI